MARTKLKSQPATLQAPAAATYGEPEPAFPVSSPIPWWIAFSFLAVLALVEIWMPLNRIQAHYEVGYNEGWNAYLQQAVADGGHIYGKAPAYTYANYPPVSFHVVGWLAKVTHDVTRTGRWIALLSFAALAALTGLTIRRLTGSRRAAWFSALCLVIFVGALKADRISMNDPHLLGMAFVAFGFYAYVRDPESTKWLRISAVAFALGLFTKQTLLAFPCAVGIQLLLTSKKHFFTWLWTAVGACVALLAMTFALDGSHFLEHLAFPRVYSYAFFLSNTVWYLLFFQTAIIVALVWCLATSLAARTSSLVWAYALAHLLAFFFAAGAGADLNHLFDPAATLAMIGGIALPYAVWFSERVRFPNALLAILLVVPFFLGSLTMLAPRVQEDASTLRAVPQLEQDFTAAVDFVRAHPGPALCESLLLCFEAGKPEEFDAYAVDQLVKTGRVPEAAILRLLDGRHFSTIQLVTSEPIAPAERTRFSQAFMTRLLGGYQMAMQTNSYAIFTPKNSPR